jgi:hypothetical protein
MEGRKLSRRGQELPSPHLEPTLSIILFKIGGFFRQIRLQFEVTLDPQWAYFIRPIFSAYLEIDKVYSEFQNGRNFVFRLFCRRRQPFIPSK